MEVFIEKTGLIKHYVKTVFTKNKTADAGIQNYQAAVNKTIEGFLDFPATAEYQQKLWQQLVSVSRKAKQNFSEAQLSSPKTMEIDAAVNEYAYQLATGSRRKGITEEICHRCFADWINADADYEYEAFKRFVVANFSVAVNVKRAECDYFLKAVCGDRDFANSMMQKYRTMYAVRYFENVV